MMTLKVPHLSVHMVLQKTDQNTLAELSMRIIRQTVQQSYATTILNIICQSTQLFIKFQWTTISKVQ